jgi:lysophospholipase L1-like esterase
MRSLRTRLLVAMTTTVLFGLTGVARAEGPETWMASWGASDVFPVGQELNYQTVRQLVRLSVGGTQVRVRFSNETGHFPLVIADAHVARPAAGGAAGAIDPASDYPLTFGGAGSVTVVPGAAVLSDPVDMAVAPLSTIAISIFLPQWTGPSVVHFDEATTFISGDGDFTTDVSIPTPSTSTNKYFLSQVEVASKAFPSVVVTLGDSITDGYVSQTDGNHRWPDRLAERLAARKSAQPVGVVNAGISGNRILHDDPEEMFGPSALARLDRDVLSVPGLRWAVLLEGINDIGHPTNAGLPEQEVSADQIIAGMKQIIARVHARGAEIFGATLTPYENTAYHGFYTPAGEAKREAVNDWIRNSKSFDAVIDFDAVLRDPTDPKLIKREFDSGDHLHPNDAGYRAMGDAVDLALFK